MPIHFQHYGRHRNVPTARFGAGDIEIIASRTESAPATNYVILRERSIAELRTTRIDTPSASSSDDLLNIDMVLHFDTVSSIDTMLRTLRDMRQAMITAQRVKNN